MTNVLTAAALKTTLRAAGVPDQGAVLVQRSGYAQWIGIPQMTDANLGTLSNTAIRAHGGKGAYSDTYTTG